MPEQQLDIEAIFANACDLTSPDERQAYVVEACAGDERVRGRIEALLRASADAGSFLEKPPEEFAATLEVGEFDTVDEFDFLTPSDKGNCLGTLGQYEVIDVIGRGGMGIVLRAYDTKLSRVVAIKAMAPELAANPSAVKRFLREARAAAAVSHEHVVTIHAIEEANRPPFIVMECIDGQSLQDKIDRVGSLELKETLRIGMQIARGLAAAHEQGLVHRDIKPANILLENGLERVKLTDFGLARAIDDVSVTQTGQIAGTPQFMSPEQANGEPIDARSDLFSLGSVLYTMCAGHPPFRAETAVAMLRRVTDDKPRSLRDIVPSWLETIIFKLLEKEPGQRFESAGEVAELLSGCLAHVQQPDHVALPTPPKRDSIVSTSASPDGIDPLPDEVKGPLRAITVTGCLAMVPMFLIVSIFNSMRWPLETWVSVVLVVGSFLSMIHGAFLLIAADRTRRLLSYRWAVTAVVLGFFPLSLLTLVVAPLAALWMLAALQQPSVRKSFGQPVRSDHYHEKQSFSAGTLTAILAPLLVVLTLGAVATIYIATDRGTLIVETDDPGIRVVIEDNGETVMIVNTDGKPSGRVRMPIVLHSGRYELRPFGDEQVELSTDRISLKRGDRVIVKVKRIDGDAPAVAFRPASNSQLVAIRTSAGTFWQYGNRNHTPILTDTGSIGFHETFVLEWEDKRQTRAYIRILKDKLYLKGRVNAEDVLALTRDRRGSELFQVEWVDRDARTFRLRTRDREYVRAKADGTRLDTVRVPGPTSVFELVELPATPSDSQARAGAAAKLVGKWSATHDPERPKLVHRFEFLESRQFNESSPIFAPNLSGHDGNDTEPPALPFRASGVWSIDDETLRLDTIKSNVKTTKPIAPRLLRIEELTGKRLVLVLIEGGVEGGRATWVREQE